jgi:hypothetical protein
MTDEIYAKLAEEFPREQVSWRAQHITEKGDSALALAYIDARDVMDRLDAVLGPDNWSDAYEVHPNVTICTIAIKVNDAWVTKADGAGDTDVEAEKGRISDAFKRAAVKWGVGRYLYAMPATWVPCDSYARKDGKLVWKKWTANPWDHVRTTEKAPRSPAGGFQEPLTNTAGKPHWKAIYDALAVCTTVVQLKGAWSRHEPVFHLLDEGLKTDLKDNYMEFLGKLKAPAETPAPTAPRSATPYNFETLEGAK